MAFIFLAFCSPTGTCSHFPIENEENENIENEENENIENEENEWHSVLPRVRVLTSLLLLQICDIVVS